MDTYDAVRLGVCAVSARDFGFAAFGDDAPGDVVGHANIFKHGFAELQRGFQ